MEVSVHDLLGKGDARCWTKTGFSMEPRMRPFVFGLGIGALLLLPACGFFGEPTAEGEALKGRVLELGSDRPVAGAVVLAFWVGEVASLADSSGVCFHVASATTDEQGRYHTTAWRKQTKFARSKHQGVSITAFKPGYRTIRTSGGTVYLEPLTGSREEMIKALGDVWSSTGCPNGGESLKNKVPFIDLLRDEVQKIAVTKKDNEFLAVLDGARRRYLSGGS
jgi:hypothetical protein